MGNHLMASFYLICHSFSITVGFERFIVTVFRSAYYINTLDLL